MVMINKNCRYFNGDRPCIFHKDEGIHCEDCAYYVPVGFRILIIKLDAIGDVLRTTSILPGLKEKYPYSQITWITKSESTPLFFNNPYVDRVFELSQAHFILATDKFDLVINLDASPLSSRLATIAKGEEKLGFAYHEKGYVYPINPEAVDWFQMGIFDDIKKKNQKTYQQIALEICRLPLSSNYELILNLTEEERRFAREFAQKHQLNRSPIIGFNTGAGRRWENKKWTVDGYLALAKMLIKKIDGCKILIYGGQEEEERNNYLKRMLPELIDTGCNNSLREFAALVDLSDILVTGDTLAMHIAIALKKKVIVLFGPTSHSEIELYGRGRKIFPNLDCICCYRTNCNFSPNCMESITPTQVFEAIISCLDSLDEVVVR